MDTIYKFVIWLLLFTLLAACSPAETLIPTSTPTPILPTASPTEMASVFPTFFDALNNGDVDLVMSLVTDDAEICFQRCATSPETIRQSIQGMINNGFRHEVVITRIEGDTIYFQHKVYLGNRLTVTGEDVMVVQDGKVKKIKGI